jgi:hypothetical protein
MLTYLPLVSEGVLLLLRDDVPYAGQPVCHYIQGQHDTFTARDEKAKQIIFIFTTVI